MYSKKAALQKNRALRSVSIKRELLQKNYNLELLEAAIAWMRWKS